MPLLRSIVPGEARSSALPGRTSTGWRRGQRLRAIEARSKPGGKYEMATLELRENMSSSEATVRRLTGEAVALNATFGDPTKAGK